MTLLDVLCIVIGIVSIAGLLVSFVVIRRTLNDLSEAINEMSLAVSNLTQWLKTDQPE